MNITPGSLLGTNANSWIPFRVVQGRIGRTINGISGPRPGRGCRPPAQSPGSRVSIPPLEGLPTPTVGGPANRTVSFSGYLSAAGVGVGTPQVVTVRRYDEDGVFDDLIEEIQINVTHAPNMWNGLLIPYAGSATLFINPNGDVAGGHGSSGEAEAKIYQYLLEEEPESEFVPIQ